MKYYIIAGEASGDIHGANLIKELASKNSNAQFRVWGGDKMEAAGGFIVKHYRDLAFMGFVEVVKNLKTILGNIKFCKDDIISYQPDVIVYVDYPGFNLRIAEWAKKEGFLNYYYISPQIWAWKESRIKKIKRDIHKMFVILPFEKEYYQGHDYDVTFVGHPLLDEIQNYSKDPTFLDRNELDGSKEIIALLPGSRKQEIKKMLAEMLAVHSDFSNYQFVIAGAPSQPRSIYKDIVDSIGFQLGVDVRLVENETYQLLQHAQAALVTSGTATLETALFEVPQIVCYKGNSISYSIAKRLIKIKYISLVNLIMDKPLVKELIQGDLNKTQLTKELNHILIGEGRATIQSGYKELKEQLGGSGASSKLADLIL